jgi:allophanate hydrolase
MTLDLTIPSLRRAYRAGTLSPGSLVENLIAERAKHAASNIWISSVDDASLRERARQLESIDPASLPLYGIPFAIKDNIDFAGLPTTAGCPAFAYQPTSSAPVVQALIDAGAIALGKTNLDQFATGLVGTRSPYGICRNAFDSAYISGGSSSGSAVAVALGLASFSLGTDTAGSGRVPAAFNNLVGYKPTLGSLSMRGVVPACRSLDAMSIFALGGSPGTTAPPLPASLLISLPAPGNHLSLAWPPGAGSFFLYSTDMLAPAAQWQRVTNAPVLQSNHWVVTLSPLTNGAGFYRLQTTSEP